jgi:hypothetical protein
MLVDYRGHPGSARQCAAMGAVLGGGGDCGAELRRVALESSAGGRREWWCGV